MQDNEFEKQVREKLSRMQMDASDTVWQRVEDGLSEKRKRRRWLIWIPLGAVLLAAGFYFTGRINVEKSAGELVQSATGTVNQKPTAGERKARKPETATTEQLEGKDSLPRFSREPIQLEEENVETNKSSAEIASDYSSKKLLPDASIPENSRKAVHKVEVVTGMVDQRPTARSGHTYEKNESPLSGRNKLGGRLSHFAPEHPAEGITSESVVPPLEIATDPNSQKRLAGEDTGDLDAKQSRDSINPAIGKSDSINPAIVKVDLQRISQISTGDALHSVRMPVLDPKSGKAPAAWRWGLTATAGRSGITTGKFNSLFYSDVASAPNYSAGNLGNSIVRRPSQVKPGLSLSLGGYVEHQLETSMYFKGGLQLSRFSTTMFVGSFKAQPVLLRSTANTGDKAIGSYYTAEHTRRYTNAYTFIDIPLSLGFNFAARRRLPFAWEIGVAPSIMLGSNALHFNQGSSIYYKDNSLLKKSQFALITSLPVTLYNGKKYTLFIAPTFRYNASDLFLPEINEKKHLLSAGIGFSINFKK